VDAKLWSPKKREHQEIRSMLETLEAWSGFVFVAIFFSIIGATFFIWVGTKTFGIEGITLKKIIITAILASVVIYIVTLVFSALPFLGTVLSYFIALLLSLFVIRFALGLTIQQSLVLWIFNTAAQILALIISAKLFIGGIKYLIKII